VRLMGGMVRSSAIWKILLVGLVASLLATAADARRADSGLLTICSASSTVRPVAGTFVYTAAAAASAGGTLTFNVPVGACASRVFYPLGVGVTVIENVPTGYAVTGITLTPTAGGGGTTSVISSSAPAAGTATVTIGTGQATLTFTTSGPATGGGVCKVPNVFGLGLAAGKAAIRKAHCTVGAVRKVYSNVFYAGRVFSQSPPRGTVLASGAPIALTVSRGHHP